MIHVIEIHLLYSPDLLLENECNPTRHISHDEERYYSSSKAGDQLEECKVSALDNTFSNFTPVLPLIFNGPQITCLCHTNFSIFCSLKSKNNSVNKKIKSLLIPGLSVLREIHCIRYIIGWITKKRAICDSRFPTVNFKLIYRYTLC